MVTLKKVKALYNALKPRGNRGQLSISNLFGFFIIIILVAVLMDPMVGFIELAQNATGTGVTSTLLGLIPVFLVVAVVMTLFAYSQTHYAQ